MMRESWSQPRRVFTVTGSFTACTTARVMASSCGTLRNMPDPAPLPATFFTGQPKLRSMTSGRAASQMRAASTIESTSRP